MAECSIARCSQERRFFRKELQKWSRDVLFVVGLERVAEELMGAGKWKRLTKPFKELETNEPEDWSPEDICYFCNAKKQPPYVDADDLSTSSDQGIVPVSFPSGFLLPWCTSYGGPTSPSSLSDQPLDLSMHSSRRTSDKDKSRGLFYVSPSIRNNGESTHDIPKRSVLKVPQIPMNHGHKKRLDSNCKRSYTEDELQAALRDIQSGKLGTRRAAVIYGIPRSTLRNKVYKLAMERNRGTRNNTSKICNGGKKADADQKDKDKDKESIESEKSTSCKQSSVTASASESLRQLLKNTITQKTQSVSKNNDKHKSDINQLQSNLFCNPEATDDILSTLEYNQALAPFLSQIISNIQQVALSKYKENYNNPTISALKDDLKLPLLQDLIRRLMEERFVIEREQHHDSQKSPQESSVAEGSIDDGGADSSANVILKIPSYKPAKSPPTNSDTVVSSSPVLPSPSCTSGSSSSSSHGHARNKGITVSLKELIARSISQKVNNSHLFEDGPPSKRPHVSNDAKCSNNNSTSCTPSASHKQSVHYNSSSVDNSKSEKRTRPKRGRYRNYDRDNLARAVRAVQRGEMSVHRAGTYFGVPHSTLEYKVKERHLLRPRKRENIASSSNIGSCSLLSKSGQSPITNVKNTSSIGTNGSNSKTQKNNSVSENIDPPNGLKSLMDSEQFAMGLSLPSQLSLWQTMPFFSMDFSQLNSNNFFASQMMRKLQENARLHEEAQQKRKNQDIGILETLIKSTLERSMSPERKSSSAPVLMSAESSTASSEKTEDNTNDVADNK
ncbi:mushroom body large-type Kenyon cell-specific protein 1 isoform X2 [Centruroides vittatus]|uniref:mushroom body large-type Kenyon cell-specific protein 1 isoform X2 n=1 Tax=Centruroides vittatus TaxID=120091 RepID=UPI0035108703